MINLNVDNDVAEIVLNNPKAMNAVDETALADLTIALDQSASKNVRALVLRGEGRGFCAGRNIQGLTPADDDAYAYLADVVTPVLKKIKQFPAPTFAAVQGPCLGVGLGLALACDVVYVADDAKIGSPFANLGATLDSGGHWLFVERLGPHRAMDLIITGDLMSGAEAVSAGLFSRAVPAEELLEFTRSKAVAASKGASLAFAASRQIVDRVVNERLGLWESIEVENKAQGDLCSSADYAEGFDAFTNKRRPTFSGK